MSTPALTALILSATHPPSLRLLESQGLGLRAFSAPFPRAFDMALRTLCTAHLLFETAPQLAIQIWATGVQSAQGNSVSMIRSVHAPPDSLPHSRWHVLAHV